MKILFTSVGRRVEMVQAFRQASKRLSENVEIVGADITPSAPALYFCDRQVMVPRISSPEYIPFLQAFCREEKIAALIPTIDTDLQILSETKRGFGETKVMVSESNMIRLCRDKRETGAFFKKVGLSFPEAVDNVADYRGDYPAFIKPKDGSSSISAYRVDNAAELLAMAERVPDYIVQPFIEGVEYTVDVFCDFEGNPLLITPRIRLAVRSGEVLKTKISQDETIISEMEQLVRVFKPCGAITVQLIREKQSGKDYYIEINPRFGGGSPLSIKAGADSAEMMIRLLRGEKPSYQRYAAEDGAVYSRFDQSVRVEG